MTLSNRTIIALATAPNAIYVLCLTGLMAWRLMWGLTLLPNGAMPMVMGISGVIPIASVAVANFLRLRRNV